MNLAPLISQLRSLAAAALPAHEDFANAVLQNRITAQNEIEHQLAFLRHILPKHPDMVSYYVNAYREWSPNFYFTQAPRSFP
jgi:hypothetical protein